MLYRPFDHLDFTTRTCFLSGEPTAEQVTVFPGWILDQYHLAGQPFKLLDETMVTYEEITVPAAAAAIAASALLERKVEEAFNAGFEAVNELDELILFQWIGKLVYGILHYEIRAGIRQQARIGERMNFSHSLVHRFSNFHFMLQSLLFPTEFEGTPPWSIRVFRVENAAHTFNYRDEINTLTFSLRMKDFGLVACLQDNGSNRLYHQEILEKVENKLLHPIQFEELSARFFYSSYLFNRLPEYTILQTPEANYVEPMTLRGIETKPLFDPWQNKVYGQVLENFWRLWGFLLLEIIKNPERPISFLEDEEGRRIAGPDLPLE